MIRQLALAVLATVLLGGVSGRVAAENPVVVELFTSQGCSSCPPADALMTELVRRNDVIPLALHVDYWDYLGWKDTMGDPRHTSRQKAYARAAGSRSIYTPQMIIGGVTHVVGNHPMKVGRAIEEHHAIDHGVDLDVRRAGRNVVIRATASRNLAGNLTVYLVRYIPRYDVAIKRGENAGRTITYVNAVTTLQEVARWDGRSALELTAPAPGDEPVVIMIQAPGTGPILAARQAN